MTTQQRLVGTLRSKGALLPEWQDTVASVDRGLFVPSVIEGGDFATDPDGWLLKVYSDAPVVTQVNDGESTPEGAFRLFTSSSTMPSIMLEMLGLLEVGEGQEVLEIGTGTGYNAAWLSHRLGEGNVTSVEVDSAVVSTATKNLKRAGFHPTTVLGDGVTPWGSSFFSGSYATLDVVDGKAQGTFSGYPAFMWDRTQRAGAGRIADLYHQEEGARSTTDIAPQNVIQDDPAFFTGLSVTNAWYRWCGSDNGSGEATLWFFSDDRKSWATVDYTPDAEAYEVEQYGPRTLWNEVRTAFLGWHELGKPERSRFGLSVDGHGQRVWLDDPQHVVGHE